MDDNKELKIIRIPNDSENITPNSNDSLIELRLKIEENETKYKGGSFLWQTGNHSKEETTGSIVLSFKDSKYAQKVPIKVAYIKSPSSSKISNFKPDDSIPGSRTFYKEGLPPQIDDIVWVLKSVSYAGIDEEKGIGIKAFREINQLRPRESAFIILSVEGQSQEEIDLDKPIHGEILFNGKHLSQYKGQTKDYLIETYSTYRKQMGDIPSNYYFHVLFTDSIFEIVQSEEILLTLVILDNWAIDQEKDIKQKFNILLVKERAPTENLYSRIITVQVVGVGEIHIVENNHKPCKYTLIEAFHKGVLPDAQATDSVTLFDETISVEVAHYPIVLGEKEATVYIKQKFLTLDKCSLKGDEQHSIADKKILVHRDKKVLSSSLLDEDIYVDTTKPTVQFLVYYDYLLTSKIFIPIHCIWPLAVKQSYDLSFNTCRHSKQVFIDVYPDIEWNIKLEVEKIKNDESAVNNPYSSLKKNKMDWNIYLAFGYTYNNAEQTEQLSILLHSTSAKNINKNDFKVKGSSEKIKEALIEYVRYRILKNILKVTDTADFILNLFDFLKSLTGSTDTLTAASSNAKIKLELRDKKYKFDINYPKFEIGMSWQAAATNTSPGILLKGKASGRLIGGTFTVDLFAVASSNAYVRIFIFAVDFIANNFLNVKLKFDLVFEANLNFKAEGTYNSSCDETDFKVQLLGDMRVFVELSFTSTKEESVKMGTKYNSAGNRYSYEQESSTETATTYGAKGEGGVMVTADIAPEDDGVYLKVNAYTKELFVKVYSESKLDNKRDVAMSKTNKPKNFQRPDTPQKREQEQAYLDSMPTQTNQSMKAKEEKVYYKGVLLEERAWQMYENGNEYKVKLWDKTPDNDVTYAKFEK